MDKTRFRSSSSGSDSEDSGINDRQDYSQKEKEDVSLAKEGMNSDEESGDDPKGVSMLWSSVNHIAIVVSDVGRSLQFYTDVLGMKQILRPDFDR